MQLIQVGENTYYIENNTNIGIYKINEKDVYLIDTGNDKEAGKKILKIIDEQNWNVVGIINTHSNADHIGGNKVIQERTNCKIYASKIEKSFTENPLLEPSFIYGGYPFKEIKNKFLLAQSSKVTLIDNNLPNGLEVIELKGHYFDMIGIRTNDNIYFLADSLFSEETINKYHLFFIYDVNAYLETLEKLRELRGNLYIPSHCNVSNDINYLIEINKNKILEVENKIYDICKEGRTHEEILQSIFNEYELVMNPNQYVLIGSIIKSYLSYMLENNKLEFYFKENKMYYKQKI